jgi:hypothetical protein
MAVSVVSVRPSGTIGSASAGPITPAMLVDVSSPVAKSRQPREGRRPVRAGMSKAP